MFTEIIEKNSKKMVGLDLGGRVPALVSAKNME